MSSQGPAACLPDMWMLPSPAATPPPSPNLLPSKNAKDGARLLVMKFGGSSLATLQNLRQAADIVRQHLPSRPVLVLSAMGKTTNELLAAATQALTEGVVDISKVTRVTALVFEELKLPLPADINNLLEELTRMISGISLLRELSAKSRDRIVSFGERLSVRTFVAVFNHLSIGGPSLLARAIDSWDAGMVTSRGGGSANSAFSQCEVLPEAYTNLNSYFEPFRHNYAFLPVVTGYIAKDVDGVITTLGRDGSDLTATVVGAAIHASEVHIWKDVSGVMTTDPRVVPAARPVGLLTFEEAAELSTFGAKVVHPAAILPAWLAKIPIIVRNSTAPEQPGTRIVAEVSSNGYRRDTLVAAMSSKRDITMIVIRSTRMLGAHGFLAHVFQVFNKFEASVDVIATSEVTVSMTLDRGYKAVDLDAVRTELEKVAQVEIRDNMSMLTLIANRRESTSVLREAFEAFETLKVEVEMVSHGASNVNVTFVIPDARLLESARELHARFFER